jgi:solute carrier family 25 folate transporter 32
MIKDRMSTDSEGRNIKLSASQHLFASASSGFVTAMITNPLWVVKTRMFTSRAEDTGAYRNLVGQQIKFLNILIHATPHFFFT